MNDKSNIRRLFVAFLMARLVSCMTPECRASEVDEDHLTPVKKALGSGVAYEQLWREKLLVTPGEVARFVGLPGTMGVETTISVYRAAGKKDSLAGNYWVTATQPSERLWNCVQTAAERKVDPKTIHIERCDAPIEQSAACAVHDLWLAMLTRLRRPQHERNQIVVDSSREIFSVVNSQGLLLQGQSLTAPKKNTKALVDIALSLLEYCGVPVDQRTRAAHDIEREATAVLTRLARNK